MDMNEFLSQYIRSITHKFKEIIPLDLMRESICQGISAMIKNNRRGYRLVLATNPVFPREAILERMRWAGVERAPWEIITTYEEYHFCKPNPNYFAEILAKMGLLGAGPDGGQQHY